MMHYTLKSKKKKRPEIMILAHFLKNEWIEEEKSLRSKHDIF